MLGRVRRMVANLVNQRAADQALDEELRSAVDILAHEKVQQGMAASEARRQALVELGGVEQVKEAVRSARALVFIGTAIADVRVASRALRRNPGFAAAAAATIALGIGANGAVFSLVNSVLLDPLPYHDPSRLVRFWMGSPKGVPYVLSGPEFFDYRERQSSLETLAVYQTDSGTLTSHGDALRVRAVLATSDFFSVLGVAPIHGRTFTREEERPGVGRVAVLQHGFWRRRFGGDPAVLGQSITIDKQPYTVVGVMAPGFSYPSDQIDLWIPIGIDRASPGSRTSHGFLAIGRLRPGRSLAQASSDIGRVASHLKREFPDAYPAKWAWDVHLRSLHDVTVGDVRPAMLLLFGAVGFVLLIACANVANLLLARGATRHREMAIRGALGASRGRVVRQLLTENLVLFSVGGLAGLGLAHLGIRALVALEPRSIPRLQEITVDWRVAAFSFGLAALSAVVVGLLPALHAVSNNAGVSLRDSIGTTLPARRRRMSQLLIVAEVALSLVLLVGAGLLMRSFAALLQVDTGFSSANVLTFNLLPQPSRDGRLEQQIDLVDRVLSRMRALPGVRAAGIVSHLPMTDAYQNGLVMAEGMPDNGLARGLPWGVVNAGTRVASPGYLPAMGIDVLNGRQFADADLANSPRVAIVDDVFARQAWPDEANPIGKRVMIVGPGFSATEWLTVVGIARHVRERSLRAEDLPQVYCPFTQRSSGSVFVAIQTTGNAAELMPHVRREIHALDSTLPIDDARTMDDRLAQAVAAPRFNLRLMVVFGALAMALGIVGLAGVIAHAVSQRTREIGIRVALGARHRQVLRLILGQGIRLIVVGLTVGLVGARALSRLVAAMLFEVSATDTVSYLSATALWFAVALLACYIPARRALQVDPVVALRAD